MKKHNLAQKGKRLLSMLLAAMMVLSCWVWVEPNQLIAEAANEAVKDHYLFAYFTGTSKEGQTIHLAVSEDGYQYTALRNNEPVIIPSKGVGNVRDPYIWYNEQDNYYYILATDLDFTDSGSDYSNNSQSFIVWRSKDLVNWYDETFIDVNAMAHLIGDTRGMTAVWAPQVLWDGSAYVVYFTLCCNATGSDGTGWNNMQLVYLKTTDIMNQDAYYEFGTLFDPDYHVIDADIIQNPADGLWYLFYKNEDWDYDTPTTDLKTIHYLIGESPTGPFSTTHPTTGESIDTNNDGRGYRVYPDVTVSLEGCNSYFDNDGALITYTDEFGHTNALGEAEAYFHISKSTDFKTFTMQDDSLHNINSLSPRHGSVVKITEEEYNRLLNNSYNITSSSYPETEDLSDHLVARYFTTLDDPLYNAVVGQPNLASATGITMHDSGSYGVYAEFDGSTAYAEVDFDSLFLNGLNYEDGFTITFSAQNFPMSSENSENNDRIYEIANTFGDQSSSTAYYTHFSPSGGGTGSYVGNYNGPVVSGEYDWLADKDGSNRDDNCIHDYIISYATGNVMVYVDGKLVISKNRFTTNVNGTVVPLDASWFKALGTESTMRIGKSGWDADPLFEGYIQNLCIYDCSMSYYDAQSMNDEYRANLGWVDAVEYNGITSVVPTFQNTDASRMQSLTSPSEHFSNILYTSNTVLNYDGNNMSTDSAVYHYNGNDFYFALYYPETTVLLLDGVNEAIMPVSFGAYCENSRESKGFLQIYPTTGSGSTADLGELEISQNWGGWYNNGDYYRCIEEHTDGYIGRNSTTSSWSHITDNKNYDCHWGAPLKVNADKIDFGDSYYKKFNLTWQVNGGTDGTYAADHSANMTSGNDIYVINFKPVLDLRESITEEEYNSIVNNTELCLELRQRYAAAVFSIRTLDPNNYGFAEAPVTATKACAKAISEAINTYEGVTAEVERETAAGSYGHQTTDFDAREATCTAYGLTSGSYCTLCGEILEEQTLIAPCAHTFGDIYTENNIQYRKCSVCGTVIEYQASEARYENLFSFNSWADSASAQVFSGTISTNKPNGTITIVNQHTTEMYTRGTYDGQNLVTTRDFANYCIPVTGGDTYVVEGTSLSSSTSGGEIFVFQYTKDGLVYSAIPKVIAINPGETVNGEFTVDANAAYIELRFDCNDAGKTITYSDIGVYTKDSADKFAKTTADARLGYYPGDDKELCYPNPGDGYTFDGWYTSNGAKIENVNQLNNPTTIVYGKWIYAGLDITYDSIFSFSAWAKSSCNQLWYSDNYDGNGNRGISTKGIIADSENGTITITNDADTDNFARTNYWKDTENVHVMILEENTDYILEYTASSNDGAKQNVCLYLTGGTATYPETGKQTSWSMGTHYVSFNSGDNTNLTLRFDNVEHGTTLTYSNIAVYKADFEEAARTIENRQYRRYYEQSGMGLGIIDYVPTRTGYTFDTWMRDTNGDNIGDTNINTAYDDTTLVTVNWQLFSTWTENSYTITYDANGGSGSKSETVKYSADVTLPNSEFTKTGHTLLGWSTNKNATSALYQPGQTTSRLTGENNGTVTLYAIWEAEEYNVTFDNMFDFSKFNIGGNLTINERTDTGFTVTSTATDGNTGFSYVIPVESGKTYIFSADVSLERASDDTKGFDMYINTLDENQVGETTSTVDTTNGAHKEGDVYISLTGQTTNTEPYIKFTAGDNTAYIKVRFDANTPGNKLTVNNIRVYEDTGVTVSPVNKYVEYGSAYGTLPTPTRTGYTFNGWKDGETTVTADSVMNTAGTVNLVSDWTANTYTITYNANGGSVSTASKGYDIEDAITLPTPTRTGYTFKGWKVTTADGNWTANETITASSLSAGKYGNVTLTAQWTANTYTIKFNANGGSGTMADLAMTYDTAKTLTANSFTKAGYTFAGWSGSDGKTYTDKQSVNNLTSTNGDTITLTAQWTANSYTVKFDGNGATGGSMTEQSITYDKATALATNSYTKTGYTFKGWSETKGGTVKYTDGQKVTNLAESGSVTLYAVWEANTYTIKFNANNGSGTMADLAMTYDTAKTLTANTFTRTGYTFTGWSTSSTGSKAYSDKESVKNLTAEANGTVTLYAIWTENTYSIEFNANGGSGTTAAKSNVKYSATVTLTANGFTREGYDFLGWSTTASGSKAYDNKETVSGLSATNGATVTLYAVWQINDSALVADKVAIDFVHPTLIKPVENDEIFLAEAGGEYTFNGLSTTKDGTYSTSEIEGTYGDFTVSGKTVTYTPSGVINGAENVLYYSVSVTVNGTTTTLTSTITVAPASNIYYEESFASTIKGTSNTSTLVDWETKGTSDLQWQDSTSTDDIYGYDKFYADSAKTFSDGTYYKTEVYSANDADNNQYKRSETAVFEFYGTGFDLISACGTTTGVQAVKISKNGENIKNYVIDTYVSDTTMLTSGDEGTALIHQVPILAYRGDSTDATYTVEVTALFLKSAGAVSGNAGLTFSSSTASDGTEVDVTSSSAPEYVIEELEELGLGDMCDNLEVRWMDDNSVLNGGLGAEKDSVFSGTLKSYFSNGKTPLTSYIDGFRVYNNGGEDYYIDSEQNPTYYHIVSDIGKGGSFTDITSDSYTEIFDSDFSYDDYWNSDNPKNEIYLKEGQAIAFEFNATYAGTDAGVMLGMRAVKGSVTAEVTSTISGTTTANPTVSSPMEMYYDITSAAYVSGTTGDVTVIIANPGDNDDATNNILAVNNLKLVNGELTSTATLDNLNGSATVVGGTSSVPTPVVPTVDASQDDSDAPEADVENDVNAPETEVEDSVEEEADIAFEITGVPAPIASFLEMLFKFLGQLVSSFGF